MNSAVPPRGDTSSVGGCRMYAVAATLRLQAQRDAGAVVDAGRSPTLTVWLDHYLDTIAKPRLRPSTQVRYKLAARQLEPLLGHRRLDRLQPEHVELAYRELADSGLAPSTVLYAHRVLSRALKVAMQRGRVARNVCALVNPPTLARVEVQPLTTADARAVLATAIGRRNAARWSVALALGLRQVEALGLMWDAVDLDAGTMRVRQALQRQKGAGLV